MKKIFVLFITLTAFAQNSFCQNIFGLKAGVNLSNQAKTFTTPQDPTSRSNETKPLWGYMFGVFYKVKMNNTWAISAETNFSLVGSGTQYLTEEQILNPDGITHYYNDKIGYIEVPLTLQYKLNKLYFGAGPAIAFKVFSKITNFENSTYKTPYYKTLDFSANVLMGYQLAKKWDVNFRYSYGLLNIYEDNMYVKTKNRFFNLSLLYSLK
jgi:Outer membrane protein beta-barrel domain